MKIRRRMGETKQIVQVNGGNILLFELAFRLLTLPLLLQAVAALFRLSVRASGYSYVTVSNLVSYLLRPVTIAILVLMAAILLVGVSIEAAGLLAAYQAAALSRKMSAFSMFAAGIRLTVSEIRKRNLRLFLVLAVHGLVLHSFLIYRMLCHVKAVKFILPALLAENWGRLLLVGVIVGAVVISLPTIFICFGCMLEQRSFRGGFLRSRELLRGNRVQVVGTLVLCNLAVTAVTVVLGMRMMGALLISSLMIFPALSAMRVFRSFRSVTVCSAVLAVCCFAAGMTASYALETPSGASVVAVNILAFGAFALAGRLLRR